MPQSEINWIDLLRSDNRAEQGAAVTELRAILLNGLRVALKDRSDVSESLLEDFTQEGLLRVLDRMDQFQGRSQFTTWAQAIALNTAYTELRRKRWQDVSLEVLQSKGEQIFDPEFLPDDVLGGSEDQTRLVAALRDSIKHDLTPRQRTGILAELRELPFDQIAELLGTNRNAAYKLLHDARRALKRRLIQAGITARDIQSAFRA